MSDKPTKITTLLKLFYSLFKSDCLVKKQIQCISTSQEDKEYNISSSEEEKTQLDTSMERPQIGMKNKWLYPKGFGKMEKGVVNYESKKPGTNIFIL